MKTSRITIRRPADPFSAEIAARLATRKAKEKREPIPASPVGPEALFDLSAYLRGNTIAASILEVR